MSRVTVVQHPLLEHRMASLRDKRTDGDAFRALMSEISRFLAYEALGGLATEEATVDTPVCDSAPVRRINETLLIVPVLRAGLGMVQAIQEAVPLTEVAHVGLRRDELSLQPTVYLNRLPRDLTGRRVVVCDPMLATGGSLIEVCRLVFAHGAGEVIALCVIASAVGVAAFTEAHPDVELFCAAVDPELNQTGFIVPGLGDAGDRLFGPPD
jgi:uracil phosphoribosyltransferase